MKRRFCFFIALWMILSSTLMVSLAADLPAGGKVTTGTSRLNVRAEASVNSTVLTQLAPDDWVTILRENGNWYFVQYAANKTGYVSKTYIKAKSGSYLAYVNTGTAGLNVRRGASTAFEIKATLPHGSCVAVLAESDDWATILFDGTRKGYVAAKYLTRTTPAGQSFAVPYYLQTDSRWKNIRIGKSGGTIGSIGCTTTCLAMMESYRTGTSITPDKMAAKLTYSSGGSLYWPSNYTTQLAGSDYLSQIQSVLSNGKPVIFSGKKSNGIQHWVVITGSKGSAKADFTINDPGSRSRTTLADFLAVYPNVYKIAYYN